VTDISSHAPGTFSWAELATSDQQAGVAFYCALLGWEFDAQPIGPGETYTMFRQRGLEVAAACSLRADERQNGVPPHWNLYVTVAKVDETVKRAETLGARVLAPAFDVMDAGRMAVLQDPVGAAIALWQPNRHIGARVLNEDGALCWSELATRDVKAAETFYASLFGWTLKHGTGGMEYTEIVNHGTPQGGILKITPQMGHMPPAWTPYFLVADVDRAAARTRELGGRVYVEPMDLPGVGRFAVLADPQGAVFDVFKSAH
jgi:predicted enzyme related to lactoylglutathione lyase